MPLWPWWGWALLLGALIAVLVLGHLLEHRRHRRTILLEQDKPVEYYPVCPTRGCRYAARVKVDSFTGPVTVCHGCADEGIAHGWFTAA